MSMRQEPNLTNYIVSSKQSKESAKWGDSKQNGCKALPAIIQTSEYLESVKNSKVLNTRKIKQLVKKLKNEINIHFSKK